MINSNTRLSIELFPPKVEPGLVQLKHTSIELGSFQPHFFSVTFGAGGTNQDKTLSVVDQLMSQGFVAAPHITGVGLEKEELKALLSEYIRRNICHLVVLRGDLPPETEQRGPFCFASDLVSFIRKEFGDYFYINVAAYPEFHPQSPNADLDFEFFLKKVALGANAAITQFFFNVDSYHFFIEKCYQHKINIPIIPGIMPINNFNRLCHFASLCGAEIPLWIKKRMEAYGKDLNSIQQFGIEIVTKLCQDLLKLGAPGLHFYSLNHLEPTRQIIQNLGIKVEDKQSSVHDKNLI